MAVLKRVARHGGTPWDQSIYTNVELLPSENDETQLTQGQIEETSALYISNALDQLGVDHVIHGGFQPVDVTFFDGWKEMVDNREIPFVAADSNLMLSDFGPADNGTIGGNAAEGAAEAVAEGLSEVPRWTQYGGEEWHQKLNQQLAAIGRNMGFPAEPSESPGHQIVCGCLRTRSPLMSGIFPDGPYTNLCGKEVPTIPNDCIFSSTAYNHLYEPCVADHMEIADKPPLNVTVEAGGCADSFAGPCTTKRVGPGASDPPGDQPGGGGLNPIVLGLLALVVIMLLSGSN